MGGGLIISSINSIIIRNNEFYGNTATKYGGAIYIYGQSRANITGFFICENN